MWSTVWVSPTSFLRKLTLSQLNPGHKVRNGDKILGAKKAVNTALAFIFRHLCQVFKSTLILSSCKKVCLHEMDMPILLCLLPNSIWATEKKLGPSLFQPSLSSSGPRKQKTFFTFKRYCLATELLVLHSCLVFGKTCVKEMARAIAARILCRTNHCLYPQGRFLPDSAWLFPVIPFSPSLSAYSTYILPSVFINLFYFGFNLRQADASSYSVFARYLAQGHTVFHGPKYL